MKISQHVHSQSLKSAPQTSASQQSSKAEMVAADIKKVTTSKDAFSAQRQSGQVARDRAASQAPAGKSFSPLGLLANNKGEQRLQAHSSLDRAHQILRDANADGNHNLTDRQGSRWREGEMDQVKDPLAKAVYQYANFVNFGARSSVYGAETRGDVQTGGLGTGFSFRPEHYEAHGVVAMNDLATAVEHLHSRLDKGMPKDMVGHDVDAIMQQCEKLGVAPGDKRAQAHAIYEATEKLEDHIVDLANAKEIKTGDGTARPTHDELLASLDPQSLEYAIAEQAIKGDKGEDIKGEPWMKFFERGLRITGRDEVAQETGKVGEVLQHYLLVVGKRAEETAIFADITANLD